MDNRGGSLYGVKLRKSSGTYYFEARFSAHEKFFCNRIKSREEGALCYDLLQRYSELGVIGEKRKAAVKLNYPEYSRTLKLKPLPSDFDIRLHKEKAMEIILKQAQAAAKNLPESLRRFTPVVGSSSPSNRSSSHQNAHGELLVAKQDLPGVCSIQLNLQELSELSYHCNMSYTSKVIERGTLEGNVEDINEASGIINPPEFCPDDVAYFMANLKQVMTIVEKIPRILEMAEQRYKSHDSKCLELRKLLVDHNLKVITKRLMDDGNEMSYRERAHEDERFPRLHEDCPDHEDLDWLNSPPVTSTGRP